MNKTYYVIRHVSTQRLLPARVQSSGWDFDRPDGAFEPRLFNTARAAKNCATCWAQGVWTSDVVTESEGWEYPSYQYQDTPSPKSVLGRSRDQLEIVEAILTLRGLVR